MGGAVCCSKIGGESCCHYEHDEPWSPGSRRPSATHFDGSDEYTAISSKVARCVLRMLQTRNTERDARTRSILPRDFRTVRGCSSSCLSWSLPVICGVARRRGQPRRQPHQPSVEDKEEAQLDTQKVVPIPLFGLSITLALWSDVPRFT